jgi:hypothetical protein
MERKIKGLRDSGTGGIQEFRNSGIEGFRIKIDRIPIIPKSLNSQSLNFIP